MDVEIRHATADDADAIAAIHVTGWQQAYRGIIAAEYLDSLDVAERSAGWRRGLSRERADDPVLVATIGGAVVGFASIGPRRDADGASAAADTQGTDTGGTDIGGTDTGGTDTQANKTGELYALYVDPDRWRAGIGSALIGAAHAELIALNHRCAVLWVIPENARARAFYESHGWVDDDALQFVELIGTSIPEMRYRRPL